MTNESFPYRTTDIPKPVIERASRLIGKYSTSLIMGETGPSGKASAQLIGSGTFVRVGDIWGIVTAQHVSERLRQAAGLGLILIEEEHSFWIERQFISILQLADSVVAGVEPDLAFIRLPSTEVSKIKTYKSFWNLTADRSKLLNNAPSLNAAPWFVCGVIGERTTTEPSTAGFEQVQAFRGQCGVGGANQEYEKDGYDYIDLDVDYDDTEDLPKSFGGISGGGAWQVILSGPTVERLEPESYLYRGVPIWQSELRDRHRTVTCHGRKSIYGSLLTRIEAEFG
jgi:hypothetical protein